MSVPPSSPVVSVIIPTYDRPAYLKAAIASAVQQTYPHLEIIVSDNCSPENPQAIVAAFQDRRIRFSRNSTNLGMFANTMKAFQMASGQYVASLLDDDLWERDFLEKLVPLLEAHPQVGIAFCDHSMIDAAGNLDRVATAHWSRANHRSQLPSGIYYPLHKLSLIDGAISPAMAAVIRRASIDWQAIPPEADTSWDMYLNYLCCCAGFSAYYYSEKLTRCRRHEQTDTLQNGRSNSGKIRKAQADIFCYRQFLSDDRLQDIRPHLQRNLAMAMTSAGIGLLREQRLPEARAYLQEALRWGKTLRTVAAWSLSFAPPTWASRF